MTDTTLDILRQLMYEATSRVHGATSHHDDEHYWSELDGMLFALSLFDIVPVREGGEPYLNQSEPYGYELRRDPDPVRYFTRYGEERFALENTDPYTTGFLTKVHDADKCLGEFCTIHNRSDHHMRSFPQHWRSDTGVMERTCPHGVGHPDPDTPHAPEAWQWSHGCDGCCSERPPTFPTKVHDLVKGDLILDGTETLAIDHMMVDGRGVYMLICVDQVGNARFITGSSDAQFERLILS